MSAKRRAIDHRDAPRDLTALPLKGLALPGGSTLLRALARLGITTAAQLLLHLPRRYEDRREITPIARLVGGATATISARVADLRVEKTWRRGVQRTIATLADASGSIEAVWYGRRFIERRLGPGTEIVASGKVKHVGWSLQLDAPEFSPLAGSDAVSAGRIVPIYRLTKGLTALTLRRAVRALIDGLARDLEEPLPADLRRRLDLPGIAAAIESAHWPEEFGARDAALRRLAFDELLAVQLSLVRRRRRRLRGGASRIVLESQRRREIEEQIRRAIAPGGVEWTADQAAAIEAILGDLAGETPMLRLLQGDVGTGKTAVAFVAAAATAAVGLQSALLAPTELLARQHAATAERLLRPLGLRTVLLVGGERAVERRAARQLAASGEAQLVIGTHALFAEATRFEVLGLVIVDEQHRFGVEERARLLSKGRSEPHLLLMTATPIPRTIGQLLYADIASSELRALPEGRRPIRTAIRTSNDLERLWSFVASEANAGRRTFVVVPRVGADDPAEEPDANDEVAAELERVGARGAEEQAVRLRAILPRLRIGVVHGRQRPAERSATMEAFASGALDVLVGTTVIEVGVDVPDASVMVVMDADRFGLATLHQLRGRVGRGGSEGWCVLVSDSSDEVARARLRAIEQTRDGFFLAERDVELRGEGDVLGTEQSGVPPLRIAALSRASDRELALVAKAEAERLLDEKGDPLPIAIPLVAAYERGWPIGGALAPDAAERTTARESSAPA